VFLQESDKFFLEAHAFVMPFLISDVALYRGNVGGAYAEGGLALLPFEFLVLLMGPARGIRLDCEDGFGYGQRRWNLEK